MMITPDLFVYTLSTINTDPRQGDMGFVLSRAVLVVFYPTLM